MFFSLIFFATIVKQSLNYDHYVIVKTRSLLLYNYKRDFIRANNNIQGLLQP